MFAPSPGRACIRIFTASLTALALSAHAAEMEEVTVEGRYLSIDKLDSVKTPTPILDVPQSLSIVTESQIRDQAFMSFGDVLRYTPGLSISQGEGHRDAIIIRGIQTTADFFIDGIRDDVQYFRPLYNVEQVEVLRGPNALLFGRGGGGGVINRVQKQPELGEQFTTLNAGADTFGAWSTAIDSNVAVSEDAAVRINAYYSGMDNHRDFFDGNAYAVNPTLKVRFSDRTTGVFSYEYVDDDRIVDRGVPSRVVSNGPNVPIRGYQDTFFGSPEENYTTLQANLFSGRIEHRFSDALRGNVSVRYGDYDKLYQNLYASDSVTVTGGTFPNVELDGYRDTTTRENLIAQANLVSEFDTGAVSHTLLLGAEFGNQDTANARQDNVFSANGDDQLVIPFTDPLDIPDFGFDVTARDRSSDVTFTSLYLQDQISLTDQFKVLLGLRYDAFDIDVLDVVEQTDGDAIDGNFTREDTEVTPRYGFIYKPAGNVSIYASYSETFLPRSGDQFLTLNLDTQSTRPQFFENREAGIKWDIRPSLSFTAAAFELDRESYTSVDPEDPAQLIVVEGSETSGVELELRGRLSDRWSLIAGYSRLDGTIARADGAGNAGNKTRQTPDNMFSIWNNISISNRLRIGLGLTYQDSFFIQEDNSVEVPDYTRLDAAAYYQLSNGARLQLNIENLTDEEYFPDAHSNSNISTGRPLNARLSLVVEL